MIAFKINQELTCEKICRAIEKLLKNGDHTDKVLVININPIVHTSNEMILKLTYEPNNA